MPPAPPDHSPTNVDVVYHGFHRPTGEPTVLLETTDGQQLGALEHVAFHSPTGMGWGYGGSGPADLALSLLLAALGTDAVCPACAGTGKVVLDPNDETGIEEPYDPVRAAQGDYDRGDFEVISCWSADCVRGHRYVPYQEFKEQYVAGFDHEWRMRRSEVLAWLTPRLLIPA